MTIKLKIIGNSDLYGKIDIPGAKNSALPIMVSSLLSCNGLTINNLPNSLKKYSLNKKLNRIVEHMKSDKKNKDSRINLILLKNIGKTTRPNAVKLSPKKMNLLIKKII